MEGSTQVVRGGAEQVPGNKPGEAPQSGTFCCLLHPVSWRPCPPSFWPCPNIPAIRSCSALLWEMGMLGGQLSTKGIGLHRISADPAIRLYILSACAQVGRDSVLSREKSVLLRCRLSFNLTREAATFCGEHVRRPGL